METHGTPQQQLTELPGELVQRISKESEENDAIYRQRSPESLDLLRIHYGHAQLLDWAFGQIGALRGARILDVGVGDGFSSVLMALAGARVTGIEVSSVALERAAALARRHGVELNLQQMPGEHLRFEEGSFDGILCMSAYHHMDQQRAASEFARVLRPGGRLVLVEPLATNPPAWLYRRVGRFLSREATSEETPLRVRDLRFLRQHFRKVEWRGRYLLSLGLFGVDRIWNNSNPLVHRVTKTAFRWVSPLDSAVLKIPGLQRIAWKIAIVAER